MQPENEILKELEHLGSKLSNIPKTTPYRVPEKYFEKLPQQILTSVLEQDLTASLPTENPFDVPQGYFKSLPGKILSVVKEEQKPKSKVFFPGKTIWKNARFAAAAMLLIIAGAGIFRFMSFSDSLDKQLASLPEETIKEYVVQSANELSVGNSIVASKDILPVQLTEEEITSYLNETGWQ
ncbi:MAG TPA: hypothetical protein PL009_04285 [Flavipsychrobacter sp.]|nr:hypothetical protein [Flavipsychrobacter sp.]